MNVFDTIQSMRPDVDPMPMADRRMIRETLFGVGHDDSARTIRTRSESGAVVSTAPHGTGRPMRAGSRRRGSVPKVAAGLLVLGAIGALGWSYANRPDDQDVVTEPVATDPTTVATTTTAPPATTEPPFVRTGVSTASPFVIPATLLTAESISVDAASERDGAALLSAPDGSSVWILAVDGAESGAFGLDVTNVGSIGLGVDPARDENALVSYRPMVPCGFVVVNEGIGQPYDRPSTLELFEAMSIDDRATIDVSLPSGWSVIDIGPTRPRYTTTFRIRGEGGDDLVSLSQIPGGSIAQFAGNGQRLSATTLSGGPAYVDVGPLDPSNVSLYWRDGDTVFNVSSSSVDADGLASFVEQLEPATADEWTQRFGATTPPTPDLDTDCTPQPSFGPTLNP